MTRNAPVVKASVEVSFSTSYSDSVNPSIRLEEPIESVSISEPDERRRAEVTGCVA